MINIETKGSFKNTIKYLSRLQKTDFTEVLRRYGQKGVDALASATPIDSGLTALSWEYEIVKKRGTYRLIWKNTNVVDGTNVAIILQYGHSTGTGGWVQGRDYINPAILPVFERINADIRREVSNANKR